MTPEEREMMIESIIDMLEDCFKNGQWREMCKTGMLMIPCAPLNNQSDSELQQTHDDLAGGKLEDI